METVLAQWPLPFLLLIAPGGGKEHLWFTGFWQPRLPDIASGRGILHQQLGNYLVMTVTDRCDKTL